MGAATIRASVEGAAAYLRDNPAAARSEDSPAVANWGGGLACRVTSPAHGFTLSTDMPKAIGGDATAPGPGWVLRAALAACDATMIAVAAALEGVTIGTLEVRVDSVSDDRGLVGADDVTPAGPLDVAVTVRLASDASDAQLARIIEWAERHSPVGDAIRRAVPMRLVLDGG